MAAGSAVLGGDLDEVSDVLGEQNTIASDCGAKDFGVGAACEAERPDRGRLDPGRLDAFGQRGWVHLVKQQLHRMSAAAVSLR
jgi:hypothetical protein